MILILRFTFSILLFFIYSASACCKNLDRAALIIGNQKYTISQLETPENDAIAIAEKFFLNDYNVTKVINLSQSEMYKEVDAFFLKNAQAEVLIVYYAGHAVQVNGRNFLIPVDMPKNAPDVLSRLFDLRYLIDKLTHASAHTKIVMLDACRDTLFAKSPNAASGLAELNAPPGTLVAFSTTPGATAEDGDGEHSPYAEALLDVFFKPNIKIEDAFKEVRRRVMQLTGNAQVPTESSLLLNNFYLINNSEKASTSAVLQTIKNTNKTTGVPSVGGIAQRNDRQFVCTKLMTKLSMGIFPLNSSEMEKLSQCK